MISWRSTCDWLSWEFSNRHQIFWAIFHRCTLVIKIRPFNWNSNWFPLLHVCWYFTCFHLLFRRQPHCFLLIATFLLFFDWQLICFQRPHISWQVHCFHLYFTPISYYCIQLTHHFLLFLILKWHSVHNLVHTLNSQDFHWQLSSSCTLRWFQLRAQSDAWHNFLQCSDLNWRFKYLDFYFNCCVNFCEWLYLDYQLFEPTPQNLSGLQRWTKKDKWLQLRYSRSLSIQKLYFQTVHAGLTEAHWPKLL